MDSVIALLEILLGVAIGYPTANLVLWFLLVHVRHENWPWNWRALLPLDIYLNWLIRQKEKQIDNLTEQINNRKN